VLAIARATLATALRFPQRAVVRIRARLQRSDEDDKALDAFQRAGKRALMAFSGDEPLYNEYEHEGRLARFDRWPNVRLETTQIADHTLRPLALQRWAHQMIDLGIEDELSRLPAQAAATRS
jgi:hypothetical protein